MFLIDGGIWSVTYQKWLLIENIYYAIQLITSSILALLSFKLAQLYRKKWVVIEQSQALQITGALFAVLSVAGFIITASLGYGVVNWILDPRTGYQYFRENVGPFYALMTTSLSVSAFFALISIKRSRLAFVCVVAALLPLAYFTGSKGIILALFTLSGQLYLFTFKRLPLVVMIAGGIPLAGLMLIQFGSADLVEVLTYFDYYPNTVLIYESLSTNHMSFFHGAISFSDFWALVPRGLYPDKPFVYGGVILSDVLYPGIAAEGHTVGLAGPINAYADFGMAGVLFSAIFDPIKWATSILFGYLARLYVVAGPDGIKSSPSLVLILFFLIDYIALIFFAFPLSVVFLGIMGLILMSARRIKITLKSSVRRAKTAA